MENNVTQYFNNFYIQKGISQKKFCEMVNIPEGTIKNMKSRGNNPSMETIQKIKRVFADFDLLSSNNESNEVVTHFEVMYNLKVKEYEDLKSKMFDLLMENRELKNEIEKLKEKENYTPQRRAGAKSA